MTIAIELEPEFPTLALTAERDRRDRPIRRVRGRDGNLAANDRPSVAFGFCPSGCHLPRFRRVGEHHVRAEPKKLLLTCRRNTVPSEELIAEAARVMADCNLELKWFLRTLFLCKVFYSRETLHSKIKSPVEFIRCDKKPEQFRR